MAKLKKGDKKAKKEEDTASSVGATDGSDQKITTFKKYDLTGVPEQALPMAHQAYKGNHSYTVWIQGCAPQPQVVLFLKFSSVWLGSQGMFDFVCFHGHGHGQRQKGFTPSGNRGALQTAGLLHQKVHPRHAEAQQLPGELEQAWWSR